VKYFKALTAEERQRFEAAAQQQIKMYAGTAKDAKVDKIYTQARDIYAREGDEGLNKFQEYLRSSAGYEHYRKEGFEAKTIDGANNLIDSFRENQNNPSGAAATENFTNLQIQNNKIEIHEKAYKSNDKKAIEKLQQDNINFIPKNRIGANLWNLIQSEQTVNQANAAPGYEKALNKQHEENLERFGKIIESKDSNAYFQENTIMSAVVDATKQQSKVQRTKSVVIGDVDFQIGDAKDDAKVVDMVLKSLLKDNINPNDAMPSERTKNEILQRTIKARQIVQQNKTGVVDSQATLLNDSLVFINDKNQYKGQITPLKEK
jgi:hypothetical protein